MILVGFLYWESLTKLVRGRLVEQRFLFFFSLMQILNKENVTGIFRDEKKRRERERRCRVETGGRKEKSLICTYLPFYKGFRTIEEFQRHQIGHGDFHMVEQRRNQQIINQCCHKTNWQRPRFVWAKIKGQY